MKYLQKIALAFAFFSFCSLQFAVGQNFNFEEVESFYPNAKYLENENIVWGYLNAPENWDNPKSNKIKIAVSVLKNLSKKENAEALVFIQGGPGAGGIQNIRSWKNHPLRKEMDIVLLDIRGTGFSEPRLCPELGEKFLNILAKNQSKEKDELQKVAAALSCKQKLMDSGVDIYAYNSNSISKDLNALKNELKYKSWNVYGTSYGTYVAQVYANNYPSDVKSLILDSSVANISSYYNKNTTNFITSLNAVFSQCKNDPNCNTIYPNLESIFYKTIAKLEKNPIEVKVEQNAVASGSFTYNAEDFKVAIQQSLYNKQLVEVIPLLIYQFHNSNEEILANLVAAFSTLLSMDYGVYYAISCNEALPKNNLTTYKEDVSKYKKLGGLSFYKSDFDVCRKWGSNETDTLKQDLTSLKGLNIPVLVFSGEFDPITPVSNGEHVADSIFSNAQHSLGTTYGHAPGFTKIGNQVTESFVKNPMRKIDAMAFTKAPKLNFASNVTVNPGIARIGKSLGNINLIFLTPLFIALLIMVVFIFTYIIRIIRNKYVNIPDIAIRIFSTITSIVGITGIILLISALINVGNKNQFILAFGLPENFDYIYTILLGFLVLLAITFIYFLFKLRKINDKSIVFSVVFSNILLLTYLLYWGIY